MSHNVKDYVVRASFYSRAFEDLDMGPMTFDQACDEALVWFVDHQDQEPVVEVVQKSTGRVRKEYREKEPTMVVG